MSALVRCHLDSTPTSLRSRCASASVSPCLTLVSRLSSVSRGSAIICTWLAGWLLAGWLGGSSFLNRRDQICYVVNSNSRFDVTSTPFRFRLGCTLTSSLALRSPLIGLRLNVGFVSTPLRAQFDQIIVCTSNSIRTHADFASSTLQHDTNFDVWAMSDGPRNQLVVVAILAFGLKSSWQKACHEPRA